MSNLRETLKNAYAPRMTRSDDKSLIGDRNESSPRDMRGLRFVLSVMLVGVVCHLSIQVGHAFKFPPHNISALWPTSAILVSILMASPTRHWWAYLLAGYSTYLIDVARFGFLFSDVLYNIADIVKVLIAAVGVRWFAGGLQAFNGLRSLVLYITFAVVLSPSISACIAALAGTGESYWFYWRAWCMSEALAFLVLAPAIFTWVATFRAIPRGISYARLLEAGLLAAGMVAISRVVFHAPTAAGGTVPVLVYLPLPFLLWAAVRFGPVGVNTALLAIAFLAISGVLEGRGPFATHAPEGNVLPLQLFLITLSLPLMFLGALIAERRERTNVLRESEVRFRSMADNSPVMIWMSGPDKKCEYFNKPWLDFTGRTFEQELGDGWAEGVHSDDLQHCLKVYTESFDARKPFEMEYRLRHKDGHHRWILDCGVPRFMADGTFAGYIGSCLDIAERKDTELQLQEQRRELTHLSRVAIVGELSGALAHELNQPLTAILSNAQAAQRRLAQEPIDLAEIRDILTDIVNEDKRAGEIIRRLRALLKKGEMQLQPLSLNELASDTVMLAHGDFVSRGILLSTELATNLPVVRGDRVQLQQVLLNLISNACDAMRNNAPNQRRLGISTRTGGNGTVEVTVTDQGPGIAPEAKDRLFEPFVTTKKEGLGLGLTICRTIVKAHGGRLWSENNAVRGAAFHVSLPALAGEPTS